VPTAPQPSLPVSGRLAWWATGWLRGEVVADLVIDAVLGGDATHVVTGLPGTDGPAPLLRALAELRIAGADAVGLALPAPGDPVGLGGPPDLNAAALDAGQAAVSGNLGFVPRQVGAAVEWTTYDALPRQLGDVGECDRALRLALQQAAAALADLDVARWRPEAADALPDLHRRPELAPPPGVPGRCVELAGRALHALAIVDLALEDDAGALGADHVAGRRAALAPLGAAARRGLVAACSPEVWPDA
jgi:hypothetical protein